MKGFIATVVPSGRKTVGDPPGPGDPVEVPPDAEATVAGEADDPVGETWLGDGAGEPCCDPQAVVMTTTMTIRSPRRNREGRRINPSYGSTSDAVPGDC
jgi:hypothetical protein